MKNEYKKPYYILFAALEDIRVAIEKEDYPKAKALIELAQLDAEEAYISFEAQATLDVWKQQGYLDF